MECPRASTCTIRANAIAAIGVGIEDTVLSRNSTGNTTLEVGCKFGLTVSATTTAYRY